MVSMLRRAILCRLNRHRPIRKRVSWDGEYYAGKCNDCGVAIYRLKRRTWRRDHSSSLSADSR
jgi:hypothetical protein